MFRNALFASVIALGAAGAAHAQVPDTAGVAAPAASAAPSASTSAKAKYLECEFSKRRAIRRDAPRCKKNLGKSRWIVVSGNWKQELTVHDRSDDAVFDGKGTATFTAGGLNGNSRFPSRSRPVRSMVSTRPAGVELEGSSTGGWRTRSRYYPCGMTIPESWKPNGFGGIFILSGKRVRVQWVIGAIGFRCDTPYGIPSPDFPDPVSSYSLKRFRNKRIVRLPIKFDFTDNRGSMRARVTYTGIARLRRYR
jgi:hypothetical protein